MEQGFLQFGCGWNVTLRPSMWGTGEMDQGRHPYWLNVEWNW